MGAQQLRAQRWLSRSARILKDMELGFGVAQRSLQDKVAP
jgi:hypothetical protein